MRDPPRPGVGGATRTPVHRGGGQQTAGAQFNSDSENDFENNSENDSEILPKSYIKKFKNLKFRHVQKLGRILRIILRIAIELTPSAG